MNLETPSVFRCTRPERDSQLSTLVPQYADTVVLLGASIVRIFYLSVLICDMREAITLTNFLPLTWMAILTWCTLLS